MILFKAPFMIFSTGHHESHLDYYQITFVINDKQSSKKYAIETKFTQRSGLFIFSWEILMAQKHAQIVSKTDWLVLNLNEVEGGIQETCSKGTAGNTDMSGKLIKFCSLTPVGLLSFWRTCWFWMQKKEVILIKETFEILA